MGTIVSTMVQTVEYYFMQFNTKTRNESRKSPIQVTTYSFYTRVILLNVKYSIF